MAEILFLFDACMSVFSGPVNQSGLKRLKIRTLTRVFPETVWVSPLKIFQRRGVARVTWPPIFGMLNADNSKTVKAADFKFDVHVSRDSPDMTP